MTLAQKIRKAKELVQQEQDGSTYLQSVCGIRELNKALREAKRNNVKQIINDAIIIKRYNSTKRG